MGNWGWYETNPCAGFPLIELLVVIAIVSLLATRLLPSCTSTRESTSAARLCGCYPLIPVIEMPSMKVFWVKKNSTMIGSATRVLAAIR